MTHVTDVTGCMIIWYAHEIDKNETKNLKIKTKKIVKLRMLLSLRNKTK